MPSDGATRRRSSLFEVGPRRYRQQIDPKFKRKIEGLIRKPDLEEAAEATSTCPVSGQATPVTSLECPTTKEELPMCVVSGRHMERDDWCICPNSQMSALYSQYMLYRAPASKSKPSLIFYKRPPDPLDTGCGTAAAATWIFRGGVRQRGRPAERDRSSPRDEVRFD